MLCIIIPRVMCAHQRQAAATSPVCIRTGDLRAKEHTRPVPSGQHHISVDGSINSPSFKPSAAAHVQMDYNLIMIAGGPA